MEAFAVFLVRLGCSVTSTIQLASLHYLAANQGSEPDNMSRHIHCQSNSNHESPAAVRHLSGGLELASGCATCRSLRLSDSVGLPQQAGKKPWEDSSAAGVVFCETGTVGVLKPFAHYSRCKCSLERPSLPKV